MESHNPLLSGNSNQEEEKHPLSGQSNIHSNNNQNMIQTNIFAGAQPVGGSHKGFKGGPNIIGNLEDMDPVAMLQFSASREVHPAGTVLIDKNMNIPTFTRTPSTYGMKARAQKRNKSRVDVFTEALIKTGVGATRQLEMQDENGNFPE